MVTCAQLEPPSALTPATWPLLPPFDQRSCCHIPTMFSSSVGLTSIQGSTSLFGNTSPDWPGTSSAVQAANGLVPETWTRGPAVKSVAAAG